MSDAVAADADVLHAAMLPFVAPDGSYARNLNTAAAEIGWQPDRLSLAMQELVAQERVLPDHPGGSPEKLANSRWLVVDADTHAGETSDVDEMTVKQLRVYADEHAIDLGDATKKDDIRDAIANAQAGVEA